MSNFAVTLSDGVAAPGEAYLVDTPVLRAHAGTQPDLFLRWNAIPRGIAAIDVVVHLHGFSRSGATMPLSEKVPRSGLDLSRRTRPTLALLPRGNWLRYSWYDFPALPAGGLDRLVDYGLERFAAALPAPPPASLALDRLILTAHSGGGMPAVDAVAGSKRPPDELYVFDGLYGRDPATGDPLRGVETVDRWLGERLAAEPARPGALRVVWRAPTRAWRHRCAAAIGSSPRSCSTRGSPSAAPPSCWPRPMSSSTGRAKRALLFLKKLALKGRS
jgi:hypothetical protein